MAIIRTLHYTCTTSARNIDGSLLFFFTHLDEYIADITRLFGRFEEARHELICFSMKIPRPRLEFP